MKKITAIWMTLVLLLTLASAAGAEEARTLTVSGTATVIRDPDSARLTVTVYTRATEASEAAGKNAEAVANLKAALKDAGLEEKDVTTGSFWVNPERDYSKEQPPIIGYEVSHQLNISVRDQGRVGEIIDLALANGATSCDSILYTSTQAGAAQDQALTAAVGEARRRAALLAEACGGTLGEILSVQEPYAQATGVYVEEAVNKSMAGTGMDTGIMAEGLAFSATVTVTFALK